MTNKDLNVPRIEILAHEIGHLLLSLEHGQEVTSLVYEEDEWKIGTNPTKEQKKLLEEIQSNPTLTNTSKRHKDYFHKHLARLMAGDIMMELYKSNFKSKTIERDIRKYDETKEVIQFEKAKYCSLNEIFQISYGILSKKKSEFHFWFYHLTKYIKKNQSHMEIPYANLLKLNKKLHSPFRRLYLLHTSMCLLIWPPHSL